MLKIIKILFCGVLFIIFTGCHKNVQSTILEQFFEDNILNKTFVITYANNLGTDITADYKGYTFVLKKGSNFYNGPLKATRNSVTYTGTWSSNDDYSKLKIALPKPPQEFSFLNIDWKFVSKNLPTLKFSPWYSTDDIQLTMERQ